MDWLRAQKQLRGGLVVAATLLALAGCGAAAATTPNGAAITQPPATATAIATAAQPTVNTADLPAHCSYMSKQPLLRIGDLAVTDVTKALSYPAWAIPQGTPNQPFQLQAVTNTGSPAPNSEAVGPRGTTDGYFAFSICNLSTTQVEMLQSVSVRVASFTPYSGPLSAWNSCDDGSYDAATQSALNGGCGGGYGTNEYLQATFPANATVGASVTAQVESTFSMGPNDPDPFPRLPFALAPGQSVGMAATLTVPSTPGTYAFAFGLALGSASPVYFSTSSRRMR